MAKKITFRWIAQAELSAAHAAFVVATGAPCTDAKAEQVLVGPVTEINNRLLSGYLDMGVFWEQYLVEISRGADMTQACNVALLWSGCHEMQVDQVAKAISSQLSEARYRFSQRFPKFSDQLELRMRPIRERWDTYGPGLLREVGRLIWSEPPTDWWPNNVTIQMLQPMRGGDGGYDSEQDSVWMEAVLADIDHRVPEVVRLAWLISRSAIDAYMRERSGDLSLSNAWSVTSVPLVLTAARELELIRQPDLPIAEAMELWQFGDPRAAQTVSQWWQEYIDDSRPLPAALLDLDRRLSANEGSSTD